MASNTIFDDVSLAALREARARGFPGVLPLETLPTTAEPEQPPEPHWTELPPTADEKWTTKVLRATTKAGFKVLAVIDYVGETLAWALGITTPKYQYVIDELVNELEKEREEKEEEEEQRLEALRQEQLNLSQVVDDGPQPDDILGGQSPANGASAASESATQEEQTPNVSTSYV